MVSTFETDAQLWEIQVVCDLCTSVASVNIGLYYKNNRRATKVSITCCMLYKRQYMPWLAAQCKCNESNSCLNNYWIYCRLWRMHTNVNNSLERLNTFIFTEWIFPAVKTTELQQWLSNDDKKKFNVSIDLLDWRNYFITAVEGIRHYLCKESPRSLPAAKNKHML